MKTVPLHGGKAAGRVVLVDDEDFELVSQYRWNIYEPPPKPGHRQNGPYATANTVIDGCRTTIRMHKLITGWLRTDHADHDGLNNQRSNLREATRSQNGANQLTQEDRPSKSSKYKGVSWEGRRSHWRTTIKAHGKFVEILTCASEVEAAYAYDAAARRAFGEFACTNFPEGPTQVLLDQWQAAHAVHAEAMAEIRRARGTAMGSLRPEPKNLTCAECNKAYQSRATRSFYCSMTCRNKASWRKRRKSNGSPPLLAYVQ